MIMGLHYNTDEQNLYDAFCDYGEILDIQVHVNEDGTSKRIA